MPLPWSNACIIQHSAGVSVGKGDCAMCVQQGLRCVCTAGTALCVYSTDTDTCARVLHSQTSSIRTRLLYAHISCMQQQAVEVFVDEEEDRADAPHNLCAWRPLAQVLLLNRS